MSVGPLIARVVIGGLFVGHGMQKLAGWFGGPGLEGTSTMMDALELHPPERNAVASGATEAVCGGMLVAGLCTPAAAAGLVGSMVTAIRTVHGSNGPWNSNRGWEYNAVIIASLFALVDSGPGALSLDGARGRVRSGAGWAFAALGAGIAASTAIIEVGHRNARAHKAADSDADSE